MLTINENINGVNVNLSFNSGINCIDLGLSGSGKTFLMTIIKSYCVKHSIDYKFFNYDSKSDDIKSILGNMKNEASIVMMDNADLYMNDEISALMSKNTNIIFIVSIKRRLKIKAKYVLFNLKYQGTSLTCKEKLV